MNATYWDFLSSAARPRAYSFQGNVVTAASSKIKTLLILSAKSERRPPDPFGEDEPPERSKVPDMWNDPMFWIMVGLH
jgi:hypothetical protein